VLDCHQVIAELANFLDEEVSADLRRDIEAHVAHCHTCEALYDSARRTLRITTESRTFELPESVSGRIVERIMARLRKA
jgi:anti-sigma factor (TIGR02949 family)